MKLSNRTLTILKNYASINPNLKVESGNVLKTVNAGQNLLSKAEVAETFPHPFAIYDLRDFLTAVGLVKDPEFEFHEKHVDISNSHGYHIRYVYAEPSTIKIQYPTGTQPSAKFSFKTDKEALFATISACAALGLPEFYLKSDGESVVVGAGDTQNKSANKFEAVIASESLPKFNIVLNAQNLKMIDQAYRIDVCGRIIAFVNEGQEGEMSYITPSMAHSIIEG